MISSHSSFLEGHTNLRLLRNIRTKSGHVIDTLRVHYHTWGRLNADRSNVIWIIHGLTANGDVTDWWPGMVGPGKIFDTDKYFIICPNIPGSCYGSSTPDEIVSIVDGHSERVQLTIQDIAFVFDQLVHHIGVKAIEYLVGPSIGGFAALDWSINNTVTINNLVLIATSYYASPWNIGINETQIMALENPDKDKGLATARAIAMISYRTSSVYNGAQNGVNSRGEYLASTYQRYQGKKLVNRFQFDSYMFLLHLFNSHDVGRNRGTREQALKKVTADTIVIGFSSDLLFPPLEQEFLAKHIPNASLHMIESDFGHDSFLKEFDSINGILSGYFFSKNTVKQQEPVTINK